MQDGQHLRRGLAATCRRLATVDDSQTPKGRPVEKGKRDRVANVQEKGHFCEEPVSASEIH